jgi:hypothetical protein
MQKVVLSDMCLSQNALSAMKNPQSLLYQTQLLHTSI